MKRTFFALLTLSTCLWLGCNRSTTVTTPDGEEVTVTEGNGGQTVTIQGPDGQTMTVTQDGDAAKFTVDGQDQMTMTQSGDGSGRVTISGKNAGGETIEANMDEEGVALPADFPGDVPIYPGGVVTACINVGADLQVVVRTTDGLQQAKTYYQDKLKGIGWEMAESMDMGQLSMLSAEKDGRKMAITISPADEDNVMITLHVETKGE